MLKARFFETPAHHIQLDATTLLQSAAIQDVHMEDVEDDVVMEDVQEVEVRGSSGDQSPTQTRWAMSAHTVTSYKC